VAVWRRREQQANGAVGVAVGLQSTLLRVGTGFIGWLDGMLLFLLDG